MSRGSKEVMYISDGDDNEEDREIAFIGSSNLTKHVRRPVPIILDDDDSDIGAGTPDSDEEQLPDLLDLFSSDPVDCVGIIDQPTTTAIKVDQKGKGKAVEPARTVVTSSKRALSPAFDGIEDLDFAPVVSKRKSKSVEVDQTAKRTRTVTPDKVPVEPPAKQTKEAKEASKAEEKARKQFEKDKAKAEKEAQKSFQRKLADANRLRTSKNDTLREIHLYLSSDLQLPSCPIAGALPEITARVTENFSELHFLPEGDSPIPGMIKFKRYVKSRYDHDRKAWIPIPEPRWEWEGTIVIIITAEEVTDMIANSGLSDWINDVRLVLGMKPMDQLMIMIKGLAKHYSKLKSQQNREYTAAARASFSGKEHGGGRKGPAVTLLGKEEIDTELVRVQMETKCFLVHVERTEDIEDWVFNLAGDVAIRPYKLLSKAHLSFCATDGIKKGSTPGDVFELMLQEVQGITPSAAAGIRAEYGSFQILMEAYERAEQRGGRERAEGLLQDCQIKNLRNGMANGRRLNKALSKRVYNVFRGEDSLALV